MLMIFEMSLRNLFNFNCELDFVGVEVLFTNEWGGDGARKNILETS